MSEIVSKQNHISPDWTQWMASLCLMLHVQACRNSFGVCKEMNVIALDTNGVYTSILLVLVRLRQKYYTPRSTWPGPNTWHPDHEQNSHWAIRDHIQPIIHPTWEWNAINKLISLNGLQNWIQLCHLLHSYPICSSRSIRSLLNEVCRSTVLWFCWYIYT